VIAMADIKVYDRVVLINEYKHGPIIVPAGTIVTCRDILNNGTAILQYGFDNGQAQYIGIPLMNVRPATTEDLDTVDDYKKLLPKVYHIGNSYIINNRHPTEVGEIISVRLATNEMNDMFGLRINICGEYDNIMEAEEDHTRQELDNFCSYKAWDIPEENSIAEMQEEIREIEEPNETIENSEDDIIRIIIDNTEFSIIEGNIIVPSVNLKDIDKLITSLNKLNKLLRKE
jgi:hypothetical protein